MNLLTGASLLALAKLLNCSMWSAKQNISHVGKAVLRKIPGHVLEKHTRNLYTFFPSSFNRKYVHTVACTVVFVGPAGFMFNAYPGRKCYLSSFQLFQQKRWLRGRFNCISTLACKGTVCVDVLTGFYGRLFVEVGQFINSKSHYIVPPLWPPFFSFVDTASFWCAESWKRVFRKSTSLPETVSAWST